MLRTVSEQPTLWESVLPAAVLRMPAELEAVDRLLDDERFFAPYRRFFHATLGRPSIPIETYLRLMFLKYRYRLGFEPLCREVADSISWSRFARIPLGGKVPHPTTLMKITTRCGELAINELNEALLAKAVEAKVLKTNRVRADTTVVEANVAYPSDSSLLAKGISRMASTAKKLRGLGYATRTRVVDRTRSAHTRARSINANLRRRSDDKLAEVKRINGELARLADRVARDADRVVRNARRRLHAEGQDAPGRVRWLVDRLEQLAQGSAKVAEQCRQRLAGTTPDGATRVVSLHDPDARPIAKGRLGKPVEFGYKAQIVDNEDGVIVDHNIEAGNPVTADRGYGEQAVEDAVRAAGSARSCFTRSATACRSPPARSRRGACSCVGMAGARITPSNVPSGVVTSTASTSRSRIRARSGSRGSSARTVAGPGRIATSAA